MPYKRTIARSLWPDLNKPVSVAAAKKAISSYNKASGRAEGTAELMVFFCEQAQDSFTTWGCRTKAISTPSCACTHAR